jgi:t-SNARE complex subunit (syntaxin)
MVIMVKEQGQALGKMEEQVEQVLSFVKEAENEIEEAESIQKKNTRRLCWVIIIILFIVLSIVAIILLIVLDI